MTNEDINDIKTVLQEQLDYIQRLGKMPLSDLEDTLYKNILGCNKVMIEIVNGPVGGIEKLVERTKQ
jgi:hypothetical protein